MFEGLRSFFEAWSFFYPAAVSATLAGLMLGATGVYIVMKRMVFLSAAVSNISSAAIAFAYFLQMKLFVELHTHLPHETFSPHAGAIPEHKIEISLLERVMQWILSPDIISIMMAILAIFILARHQSSDKKDNSAAIAVFYLFGAAATLVIGTQILSEIQDIEALLFGNAVLVSQPDFYLMVILSTVILCLHAIAWRGFSHSSFDYEGARVAGLPVDFLQFILLLSLAIAIALTTRILGALPAFAFSVLPAIAARLVMRSLLGTMIMAAFIGATSGFVGYILAYIAEFPVGPSQALVAMLAIIICLWIHLSTKHLHRLMRWIQRNNSTQVSISEQEKAVS